MITRSSVADELENKHKVVTNLVHSLCSRISELQQKITAATAAAAGGGDNGAAAGVDAAAIKAAALAEMQEGSWGHAAIVKEYLTMLRTLAANSTSYFPEELPAQLWDALMVSPPDGEDHMPATQVCLGFVARQGRHYLRNPDLHIPHLHFLPGHPSTCPQLFFMCGSNDYPGSCAYFWIHATDISRATDISLTWISPCLCTLAAHSPPAQPHLHIPHLHSLPAKLCVVCLFTALLQGRVQRLPLQLHIL
jgi:hypothetical protein